MSKRRPPQRPPKPNDKGISDGTALQVRLMVHMLVALKQRARYETMHWRIEHGGHGKVISPADIVRRLIADYQSKVSPLPNDAIGNMLRDE